MTLSTLLHAAWSIVLGRYTGKTDVVFGSTTSGRGAPVPRIEESIAGLFINAVPVRVLIEHAPLAQWLTSLQEHFNELRSHEHVALSDIQRWSDVPRGEALFETLLTIENYQVGDAARDVLALGCRDISSVERTHYPLSVVAVPGPQIRLTATYDAARFAEAAVPQVLAHLEEDAARDRGESVGAGR